MNPVRKRAASTCLCAFVLSAAGGCVSGMQYKVPMPKSLTLGTVREEPATLAASQVRRDRSAVPVGAPGANPALRVNDQQRSALHNFDALADAQ